jgi:hypothetical protein
MTGILILTYSCGSSRHTPTAVPSETAAASSELSQDETASAAVPTESPLPVPSSVPAEDENRKIITTQLSIEMTVQETGYYCVPACVKMIFRLHGIEMSQDALAEELHTDPVTGTEYIDTARVLNRYLFNKTDADVTEAGYHVQTFPQGDHASSNQEQFEKQVRRDIKTDDPVQAAVDRHVLYPSLSSENHMILITGYASNADTGQIAYYYFIDPSYVIQDSRYGGLKTASADEMIRAIEDNVEPAYIW